MSASTRTVQRTLGTSQLGGMLVLLAVLAAIVAALAFGSIGAKPAEIAPAAGFAAPVVRDLGARDPATIQKSVAGYWQPDGRGGLEFVPTLGTAGLGQTDMSGGLVFQPVQAGDPVKGGLNDERLHAR